MKNSGFTLVELVVVMAVIGILMSVGVPSMRDSIARSEMRSAINNFVSAVRYARSEAAKRGFNTYVTAKGASSSTNEFGGGYTVWVDENDNGALDANEKIRDYENSSSVTLNTYFGVREFFFNSQGKPSVNNVYMNFCDSRVGEKGKRIYLIRSGQIYNRDISCA